MNYGYLLLVPQSTAIVRRYHNEPYKTVHAYSDKAVSDMVLE